MNVNRIDLDLILDTRSQSLKLEPEVKESWAINMISMINNKTTPAGFEARWKKNPGYRVEMRGPIGPCSGGTGLHMAVSKGNLNMTKFFIEKLGIEKIDLIDHSNKTPLELAVGRRTKQKITNKENLEIIRQLLMAGADANLYKGYFPPRFDGFYDTLLTEALEKSDLELVKLLLEHGARKSVAFTPDKTGLIKQKFTYKENEIYKQAKNENKIQSSNQKRIDEGKMMIEAKKLIEENKEQARIYGMVDLGNTWMIGNYY